MSFSKIFRKYNNLRIYNYRMTVLTNLMLLSSRKGNDEHNRNNE